MQSLGKVVVVFGLLLVAIGAVLMFSDKLPFIGKLPGDITIKRESFQLHIPVTTSIVLSVVLSLLLWAISHFRGR